MILVSLRRQRAQLLTLLGMLIVGGGVIALLRSTMVDALASAQLTACVTLPLQDCVAPAGAAKAFQTDWETPFSMGQAAILGLPVLIGVFIGAPLFARELEQGTHILAFTQSVSRTRWMVSKLVVALLPAVVVLIALQYLVSWWLSAAGTLGPRKNGPFYPLNFGIDHVSPVGYALFAFALGAFIGVVSRRTLVAMTAGLTAFIVARFALAALVDRMGPVQRVESAPGTSLPNLRESGSLVLDDGWLDAAGQAVPSDKVSTLLQACKSTPSGAPNSQEGFLACLPQSGLTTRYTTFIPADQSWQVHLVDGSIFAGLAVLLLVGTAVVLRRQS